MSKNTISPVLVWYCDFNGAVTPQRWAELDYGVGDWKKNHVVACHVLVAGEKTMSLNALSRRYPAPKDREAA